MQNIVTNNIAITIGSAISSGRTEIVQHVLRHARPPSISKSLLYSRYGPWHTALHTAIANGYSDIVEILLNDGANIDAQNGRKQSPLHLAAHYGIAKIVKLLLDRGADPNSVDDGGFTPLHFAAMGCHEESARLLLNKGARVEAKTTQSGISPLHSACMNRCQRIIKLLLDRGADVNNRSGYESTPLHITIEQEDETDEPYCSMLLLERGANINAINYNGVSPLCLAAERGLSLIVKEILLRKPERGNESALIAAIRGRGENYEEIVDCLVKYGIIIRCKDMSDHKILHEALENRHFPAVEIMFKHTSFLLRKCIDLGCFESLKQHVIEAKHVDILKLMLNRRAEIREICFNDLKLFHSVAEANWTEGCKLLVEHGFDINACDKQGYTALHHVKSGKVAEFLLNNGAKRNAKTKLGLTPLHVAVQNGNAAVVMTLLRYGNDISTEKDNSESKQFDLNVNIRDHLGRVPLHYSNFGYIAKILLDNGAEPNVCQDYSPIHAAVQNECEEVFHMLVQYGANINAPTKSKSTPLHLAAGKGNVSIVRDLICKGANVNAAGKYGLTPLGNALLAGHIDIVEMLLNSGANDEVIMHNYGMPLHYAARQGQTKMVECLVRCNAYIDLQDDSGKTALHIASENEHHDVVQLLLDGGADVNITSKRRQTALNCANNCKRKRIAFFIETHIIKLKAAGLFVNEQNLRPDINLMMNFERDNLRAKCIEELEKLKREKLGLNCSLYQVLTTFHPHRILNDNLVQDLKCLYLELSKFPLYGNLLDSKIKSFKRRKELLPASEKALNAMMRKSRRISLSCKSLKKILCFLDNRDLKNLILSQGNLRDE